ncbi:Tol-Pal system beta propeller repeat protein TolB [Pseudoduganella sp. HUAS MS19]
MNKAKFMFVVAGAAFALSAQAQLRVEISGVGSNQIPVAIGPCAGEASAPAQISEIVKADLTRSGMFKIIDATPTTNLMQTEATSWKARGADALVACSVQTLGNGQFEVQYRLMSTVQGNDLSGFRAPMPNQYGRLAAHKIADDVYEKLTGIKGVFSTRIAYVIQQGRQYRLEVADADGENVIPALTSTEPIISPSWSPDGTKVAYVSFEQRKPVVYVQNLVTRQRTVVANEKGNNSAPAWSPDGKRLAVALSKPGNTQIYIVNADGSGIRRLTNGSTIDTEPQFSADGQYIYFTSDRSGGPQIYRMSVNGGEAQRVTFGSSYNISPRISADGKTLAYISRRDGGAFQLFVMDLESRQEQRLSDTTSDDSPSFAPNGKYILYATQNGGRRSLAVASTDGRVKQRLSIQAGNIKEPTWGPFMK